MANINKKKVKDFLKSHRDPEVSAAKIAYSRFLYKGMDKAVADILGENKFGSAEDKAMKELILGTNDGETLVRLMRKPISGLNVYHLRQRLLANEEAVMPLIKKRALTNRQDIFIESAMNFFLYCRENVSDWIVENYSCFKSEYLRSMFCLVLGFRGEKELIPFMISEAERMEKFYPDEYYDQGPALAVQELACRFLN